MRICIDLDGVVAQLKRDGQSYADIESVPGAVQKIRSLRAAGHTIILFTARHMMTCGGNVGQVLARQGKVTFDWLDSQGIEFDEIYFGKPQADIYIDDNGLRFSSWDQIDGAGENLPCSRESTLGHQAQ